MKFKAYLAGSVLFLDGSLLTLFKTTSVYSALVAGVYLLGSSMFILGTLAGLRDEVKR